VRHPLFVAGILAALCCTSPALAQEPEEQKTITVVASATVRVDRPSSLSEVAIGRVVKRAHRLAIPKALAAAREEASTLANAANLPLGSIQSISQAVPGAAPYGPFPPYGAGTFGDGLYCGTTRVPVFSRRRGSRGRRVVRFRTVRRCRVPAAQLVTLTVVFRVG
jgi:uncharacterized protein YggE